MTNTLKPRDAKDVETAVQWALGDNKSLEIIGRMHVRAGKLPFPDIPRF
jgi:hypothetical protein